MLKSLAVVIGSYILSILLVFASDPLLSGLFPGDFVHGRVPSDKALMASTVCFVIISIICSWVCARFAPPTAARHVLWFFLLGEVLGIATTIPNWNKGWPHCAGRFGSWSSLRGERVATLPPISNSTGVWPPGFGLSWPLGWARGCCTRFLLRRGRAEAAPASPKNYGASGKAAHRNPRHMP